MSSATEVELREESWSRRIRRIILDQSYRAHVGHIGSALSIADIVAALYEKVLRIPEPGSSDRDRFVLSKGHAALALYAALYLKGWISRELLDTYCSDHSLLGVHPEHTLPGIDFSTGSLGQGVCYGTGAALAAKLERSGRRVFVVLSDAECNEGSVWEAAMFASHHQLSNLILIIDVNGQQAFGYTRDVLDLSPLAGKWKAFGWEVHEIDGNDAERVADTIAGFDTTTGLPRVLVARTVFGKGVPYMEGQIKWHYWPMNREEYELAIGALEATR